MSSIGEQKKRRRCDYESELVIWLTAIKKNENKMQKKKKILNGRRKEQMKVTDA